MTVLDGELLLTDTEGAAAFNLSLRLTPGRYFVLVRVSGRDEARAMAKSYLGKSVPDDMEPVQHWFITFVPRDE